MDLELHTPVCDVLGIRYPILQAGNLRNVFIQPYAAPESYDVMWLA